MQSNETSYLNFFEKDLQSQLPPPIIKSVNINNTSFELSLNFSEIDYATVTLVKLGEICKYQAKISIESALSSRAALEVLGMKFVDIIYDAICDNQFEVTELAQDKEYQLNFKVEVKLKKKTIIEEFSYKLYKIKETIFMEGNGSFIDIEIRMSRFESNLSLVFNKLECIEKLLASNNSNYKKKSDNSFSTKEKDEEIEALKKIIESKEQEIQRLNIIKENTDTIINSLNKENYSLKNRFEEKTNEQLNKIKTLKKELTAKNEEVKNAKKQEEEAKKECTALRLQIQELKMLVDKKDQELNQIEKNKKIERGKSFV